MSYLCRILINDVVVTFMMNTLIQSGLCPSHKIPSIIDSDYSIVQIQVESSHSHLF